MLDIPEETGHARFSFQSTVHQEMEGLMGQAAKSTSRGAFPLRLPLSTRLIAADRAKEQGLSLNHFIALAVAEKIARLDIFEQRQNEPPSTAPPE